MENNNHKTVDNLWNEKISEEVYGSKYKEHIFEQYRLYVQMADNVSARRNLANTFFLTLNTFILSIVGVSLVQGQNLTNKWMVFIVLAPILLLCIAWWMIVRSYRQLNSGKFKVIGEYERKLPTSPYWAAEWKVLGEGKDIKKYLPLTYIENLIPLTFAILYISLVIFIYFAS